MKIIFNRLLKNSLLFVSIVALLISGKQLSGQVNISEEQWILPTYKVNPPDKNPMFFNGEGYQGASRYIYPLPLLDNLSNEKSDQAWKVIKLANEFIELCITPEIGGKLWYGTDKTNGYNFVYKNNVVRPSNIGMTGAWVSGGIEWCVLHHHRASTFIPVDYEMKENTDGSKTIWIGETEPRHGMRWTIGITVFPGKSYFEAEVKIHNQTPFTHTFLYWANVASHTNENYQVIFPPSVQYATYHAKNAFIHWPVAEESYRGQNFTKGNDMSWWKNSPVSNSFFAHDLKEDFMGGYDHGKKTGTVHIGGFKYANLNGAVNLDLREKNAVFLGYHSTQKVSKAKILLKNGDYVTARKHFAIALKRLTKDYTRPSDCEALYFQGLTLKALGLYDEAIDTLYRATWDHAYHSAAYLELAKISAINGDLLRSLDQNCSQAVMMLQHKEMIHLYARSWCMFYRISLRKAVEYSNSNLWADTELQNM